MKNVRLLPSNPANAVSAVLFGGVLGSLLGPGALAQVEQWDMLGKYRCYERIQWNQLGNIPSKFIYIQTSAIFVD